MDRGPPADGHLRAARRRAPGVRFVERFVDGAEAAAVFRRADLVVLPYREIEGSGVLATALAFGRPLLLTDVGSFPEVAETGAAELVPAGDAAALHDKLVGLVGDAARRAQLAAAARAAAEGPYAWGPIAERHLALYGRLPGVIGALAAACAAVLAYAQAGYALVLAVLVRVLPLPRPVAEPDEDAASARRADRRRPRRGAGDRREDPQRARSRLGPGSAGRSSWRATARATTPSRGRAPPAPIWSSTCRGAARSAPRTRRSTR